MKTLLTLLLLSSSVFAEIKYQEPVIPAKQGKLYNAIISLRKSDSKTALAKFSELPKEYSPAFDFLRAVILLDQKLNKRAKTFLNEALKKMPNFYQARLSLAQTLLNESNYKDALPELLHIIKLGRADGPLWISISKCHLEMKNYSAAEACLSQAKIFLPNNKSIDQALLDCYLVQEDFSKAEKLAEKLLDENKDNKYYWRAYIQSLTENGKRKEALLHQQVLISLFKAEDNDIKLLADMYYNDGVYLKAADLYLKVQGKLSAKSILQAARCFTYAKANEKVIGILKNVDAFSPSEKSEFYNLRGQAYLALNKEKDAINSFLNALKFDSQNTYVQYYIAELYEKQNKSSEALDYYSRASKNKDFYINAKLRKAHIYIKLNQKQKALEEVLEVKEKHTSDTIESYYKYLKESQK